MPDNSTALVAIDWGTSSLRGARLNAQGQVLEEISLARGILTVPAGGFDALFDELFGGWLQQAGAVPCLISGMAGSHQGWVEAPYCACPAGFAEVAQHLAWVRPGQIAIVPGLNCFHENRGLPTVPDVMRGEEVQIFGAMQLTGVRDGLFVLPGTHSKWAQVADGQVLSFQTCMTGEFFALLSQHSILGRTLQADAPFDAPAFERGVLHAQSASSLLHSAFSARTLALFEQLNAPQLNSYLSGLVIGEEIRAQRPADTAAPLVLVGSAGLTSRYSHALDLLGIPSRSLGAEATWAGLHALAQAL